MKLIKFGEVDIARIIRFDDELEVGLNFMVGEKESLQVGVWNHPKGTTLSPHVHKPIIRNTVGTQEVVYVISGLIHLDLYGADGEFLYETNLSTGDICVSLAGGHGYRILESGTKVLEVKNGPYFGQEADKKLIKNLCPSDPEFS
jgi:hypothetical protein